jgi:hypothetical protein
MLNDTMQSLFVAAYPIFKGNFDLSFTQIGALTLGRPRPAAGLAGPLRRQRRPDQHGQPRGSCRIPARRRTVIGENATMR